MGSRLHRSPPNMELFYSLVTDPVQPSPRHPKVHSRYMNELEEELRHSKNIEVYKNGKYTHTPKTIHLPSNKLDSMDHVLEAISDRINFKYGYPECLYHLDGTPVRNPEELENHERCVLASNMDTSFHSIGYPCEQKLPFRF